MGSKERNDKRAISDIVDLIEERIEAMPAEYAALSLRGITERQIRSELRRRGWRVHVKRTP